MQHRENSSIADTFTCLYLLGTTIVSIVPFNYLHKYSSSCTINNTTNFKNKLFQKIKTHKLSFSSLKQGHDNIHLNY